MTHTYLLILCIINVCIGIYYTRQLDKIRQPSYKFISKLIGRWIRQDKGNHRAILTVLAQDEDDDIEGQFGIGGRKDLLKHMLNVHFDKLPELLPFLKEVISEYESKKSE